MSLTDDDLFDFDQAALPNFDEGSARQTLERLGDVYRSQLVAAMWIDDWRAQKSQDDGPGNLQSDEFKQGIDYGLRKIIAHLRKGDLVPGGYLHDAVAGRPT